jgi:hypothetical protein
VEELIQKYIWAPVIAIFGILIVGAIIEDVIGIAGATVLLFSAVGGIAFFAKFFKR